MKQAKTALLYLVLALVPFAAYADSMQDMMKQYQGMGDQIGKNMPAEIAAIFPKGFDLKVKNFVYKETANMFLMAALSGTRKNDAYPKFGHEGIIEVGIMAYNKATASYMAAQMPVIMDTTRREYAKSREADGGGWKYDPVAVSKINGADVYIQKGTRLRVELDDHKYQDQVYYNADVVMLHKNALLTVRIVYYPSKKEGVTAAISHITKTFLSVNLDKFMK